MFLQPTNLNALTHALADAHARGEKVTAIQLSALNRVLEYTPEDMTVTVEAGITLAALQSHLAAHGQWLPIDPPQPERANIGAILVTDASGPRRFGYGTIREHLIGLRVALADGRLIKAGGKVVKNVAGYDLCKVFVGSHGSLGVIVEATFKLRPLPEAEQFVEARCASLERVGELIDSVLASELNPMVMDLHNLSTNNSHLSTDSFLVLGFAGSREEVDWQLGRARELGISEPSNLDYEITFLADGTSPKARSRRGNEAEANRQDSPPPHVGGYDASRPRRLSVLPSKLTDALRELGEIQFVARAGNGVIYFRGGPESAERLSAPPSDGGEDQGEGAVRSAVQQLTHRLKNEFDPKHIFPELPER